MVRLLVGWLKLWAGGGDQRPFPHLRKSVCADVEIA